MVWRGLARKGDAKKSGKKDRREYPGQARTAGEKNNYVDRRGIMWIYVEWLIPPVMPGSRPTRPNRIFTSDYALKVVPKAVPNPSPEPSQAREALKLQAPITCFLTTNEQEWTRIYAKPFRNCISNGRRARSDAPYRAPCLPAGTVTPVTWLWFRRLNRYTTRYKPVTL